MTIEAGGVVSARTARVGPEYDRSRYPPRLNFKNSLATREASI